MSGPMRVLSGGGCLLHRSSASRSIEAHAQSVHAPHALMQRAGSSVARLALAIVPHMRRCLLLAGPGNNGGDAMVAAAVLKQCGVSVQLVLLAGDKPAPDDAAWALQLAQHSATDKTALQIAVQKLQPMLETLASRFPAAGFSQQLQVLSSKTSSDAQRKKAREEALRKTRQLATDVVDNPLFVDLFRGAAQGLIDIDVRPQVSLLRAGLKKIELAVLVGV